MRLERCRRQGKQKGATGHHQPFDVLPRGLELCHAMSLCDLSEASTFRTQYPAVSEWIRPDLQPSACSRYIFYAAPYGMLGIMLKQEMVVQIAHPTHNTALPM